MCWQPSWLYSGRNELVLIKCFTRSMQLLSTLRLLRYPSSYCLSKERNFSLSFLLSSTPFTSADFQSFSCLTFVLGSTEATTPDVVYSTRISTLVFGQWSLVLLWILWDYTPALSGQIFLFFHLMLWVSLVCKKYCQKSQPLLAALTFAGSRFKAFL